MSVAATHSARFSVLELHLPGKDPISAGVLLENLADDRLYLRLRRDWEQIAPEEAEVLLNLERDISHKAFEMGAKRLFEYLEDTLSNTLQLSQPREAMVEDFDRGLARLYREHVHSTVCEFITHLPRYSLAVAAGKFLDNQEITCQGWDEAPPDLKVTREMFVARIAGKSMEPVIPDGSLCIFRAGVTGSRQGRLVLVEALGRGENDRYTVKRYRSEKGQRADGSWNHERIRLEAVNPEFESWDLDPEEGRFRVIAEFVRVLE